MLKVEKKKVLTLFALTLLITSMLLSSVNLPSAALPTDDLMYLHGPSLVPIHMDGPSLTPVHMHSFIGFIDLYDPWGTPWHELYPEYCQTWIFTSWEDNGNGYLDSSDQIDLTNELTQEVRWYHVDRVTMTLHLYSEDYQEEIYVEYKGPYDPYMPPVCTLWHEVWPVYGGVTGYPYHIIDWIDNGNGILDFCDYIMFEDWMGIWWHVEEYSTDLILNEKIMNPIEIEWHELYPEYCNYYITTSWEEPIEDPFPGRLSPGDQIDMWSYTYQKTKWYYVDRVTFTMLVTNETNPDDWMYIEYKGPFETMYDIKTTVVNSTWHEVYPFYSASMNITGWIDNCNGVLDYCDYIEMYGLNIDLYYGWWHVESLSIDIILNEKIDDPTGIIWHELYPECCVNDYETLGWEDNGNGLLNPCDNITLALLPTGLTEDYHVEAITLTLNLTVEDAAGSIPFTVGERIYIEYLAAIYYDWELMYYPKTHPLYTDWEVVCPNDWFGYSLTIENWWDNCNGVLSYCDILELLGPDGAIWCHVDEVAVDITVKKITAELHHDVAVTNVFSIYNFVYQGATDPIKVTVANEGDFTEAVDVFAFYAPGNLAAPKKTVVLNPGDTATLTFIWDTTGITPGFYTVSANATITIDDDPSDNVLTGNTEEVKQLPPWWFIKKPYPDYAPSGMPDIDEKQDIWGPGAGVYTWCGPVAVANSLWWFDSKYESIYNPTPLPPPAISDNFPLVWAYGAWDDHDPQNVDPLIRELAFLMDTDGQRTGITHIGTSYIDLETGLSQYLQVHGVNPLGDCDGDGDVDDDDINIIMNAMYTVPGMPLWDMRADIILDNIVDDLDLTMALSNYGLTGMFYEHTEEFPQFPWIEEEIYRCEDVVLFLEFWVEIGPGEWVQFYEDPNLEGGHFVTCAGVNSTTQELLISDPYWDAAEAGFPGDVPVSHAAHADPTIHNDVQFVSHDAYSVLFWTSSPNPYEPAPVWELVNYMEQLGYGPNYHAFIRAAIATSPLAEHDVAVTNVTTSKTGCLPMPTVGEGFNVNITVTVENQGSTTETFNVTVYANATIIGTAPVTLNSGYSTTVKFVWSTTGFLKGNYTISATADTVPGEVDIADNTFIDGLLAIVRQGDVNGDGYVNAKDAILLGTAFYPTGTYNPNADINNDGYCNAKDAIIIGANFDV